MELPLPFAYVRSGCLEYGRYLCRTRNNPLAIINLERLVLFLIFALITTKMYSDSSFDFIVAKPFNLSN